MRTFLRGKVTLLFMMLGLLIAIPAVALAAELVTSELDATTPNQVTVAQGGTTSFNIGLTAIGSMGSAFDSSNASTATVDTVYSLNNTGAVSGSTPSSAFTFYSSGTGCNGGNCDVTWDGAPTPYSVGASVSAASDTPVGDYLLVLSDSANTTDLINPSGQGGKLSDTTATTITVHVVAPTVTNHEPVLTLPTSLSAQATSNSQATVNYTGISATDEEDGDLTSSVECTPASGSTFNVGPTTVECSVTDSGGLTDTGSFTVHVYYGWTGFFQPVDNPDTLNSVKAGSAVPVKCNLSGNQGLSIFASEIVGTNTTPTPYPRSVTIPCDQTDPVDAIEATVTAGQSSLSYDALTDQYNYVWKTEKSWAGTCRQLVVKLKDGTTIKHANFKLLK